MARLEGVRQNHGKTNGQSTRGLRKGQILEAICFRQAEKLAAEAQERDAFKIKAETRALELAGMHPGRATTNARSVFRLAEGNIVKSDILAEKLREAAEVTDFPGTKRILETIALALEQRDINVLNGF